MDTFKLQRSLIRSLLKQRPPVVQGMTWAMKQVVAAPNGSAWKKVKAGDWKRGEKRWLEWFSTLLRKSPPPRDTELLWFETPSDLNLALTSVSAYSKLASPAEGYGMGEGRTWPEDKRGFTLKAGLLLLPELDEVLSQAGWPSTENDHLEHGVFALSSAYTALLVINGLPQTTILQSLQSPRGVAVVFGWAAGDVAPIGQLTVGGWTTVRRVPRSSTALAEELDPESFDFNPKKYVAQGGDINARIGKSGETILLNSNLAEPHEVRRLLELGADASATDNRGRGAVHHFGATELSTLRMLVAAGADPKLVDKSGLSAFDAVVWDGRCTLAHVKFMESRGARLRQVVRNSDSPLHSIAYGGMTDAADRRQHTALLRHFVRKHDVNARRKDGMTPLWVALHAHATELLEHIAYLRKCGPTSGLWKYRRDEMAVTLLKHGADPNARYRGPKNRLIPAGGTPLMVQRFDDDRLVRVLLQHGADPLLRCNRGKTALDYATAAARNKATIDKSGAESVVAVLTRATERALSKR